jgi:hypothetical protein
MGAIRDRFEVNVARKLHVLGMNAKNFKSSVLIRYTNIDFTIETTSTSKRGVNSVRSIGSTNHDGLSTAFNTVHQCEQLSDNTLLNLTLGLLSVGCNRINFVDEQNSRLILLALFEGLSEVLFGLTLHFGHNFGSVQTVEESTCLIGDSFSDQSLTRTGWAEKKHTFGWLDTESFEKLGMT